MSINMLLGQVKKAEVSITTLNKKIDVQKLKESKAIEKMARAQQKMMSVKTISTANSAQREYQSASNDLINLKS